MICRAEWQICSTSFKNQLNKLINFLLKCISIKLQLPRCWARQNDPPLWLIIFNLSDMYAGGERTWYTLNSRHRACRNTATFDRVFKVVGADHRLSFGLSVGVSQQTAATERKTESSASCLSCYHSINSEWHRDPAQCSDTQTGLFLRHMFLVMFLLSGPENQFIFY